MPQYNALADRPSNMLAYPDAVRATPRNEYLGALADLIAQSYSPVRTQQMQGTARFLSMPAISQTLDRLSYGEPLTTGAGGLGGTTRVRPEALEAGMAVAPMAQPVTMASLQAARAARQAALRVGMAGERYAERVVPGIMERGGMPAQMLNALANRTVSPLDVYHGSPHRFPPTARNPLGEFDASKIGTGEGAQVYGHGLYTAEAPAVATEYAKTLSSKSMTIDNQPIDKSIKDYAINKIVGEYGNDLPKLKSRLNQYVNEFANNVYADTDSAKNIIKAIDEKRFNLTSGGNVYKVNLPDEKVAKMLDWDQPMSEQQMIEIYDKMQQSPLASFAKAFQDNFYESMNRGQRTTDGQDLFMELSKQLGGQKYVSEFLRSIGIPGIKYLDEKSRSNFMIQNTYKGKPYGEPVSFMTEKQAKDYAAEQIEKGFGVQEILGTRNFVVFPGEEKSMTILERNAP